MKKLGGWRLAGKMDVWENMISRNPPDEDFEILGPAKDHYRGEPPSINCGLGDLPLSEALARDVYPLPVTPDREGYHGSNHFKYWASGLRDMHRLLQCANSYGVEVNVFLDIGCASGRVLRHFAINSHVQRVMGCDINSRHVDWIMAHLPKNIEAFQNTSIPTLQVEDSSVDLVSCFSVFTHVENFDSAWIMEIKRVLRPGGIAWITFLSERHWIGIKDGMPRYRNWYGHPEFAARRREGQRQFNRLVFRQRSDRSYSSIVFYNTEFLRCRWGRILDVLEVRPTFSAAQDVLVMQKTRSP